jgi:Uncharacterized protein containing a Zn-ribbon (DUF2116)
MTRTCVICGSVIYGYRNRQTCSSKCRVALHRTRKRAEAVEAAGCSNDPTIRELVAERQMLTDLMASYPRQRTEANYRRRDAIDRKLRRAQS